MNTICFLVLTFYGVCIVLSSRSIPYNLRECYKNTNIWSSQLPMNLQVIIDIIRKAERQSHSRMNLKTFSSSLLRRFKFDGVRYNEKFHSTKDILPFIADQPQSIKQEIVEELIPGNPDIFPSDALTVMEYCTLHQAMSSTIWYHQLENEDAFCTAGPFEKLLGRSVRQKRKICPKENGVVLTRFGTIALGSVISAIAASLQPQFKTLSSLVNQERIEKESSKFEYNEKDVDLIVPKNKMLAHRSMWLQSLSSSSTKLDNVWTATLAGELAEVAIYQGPIVLSEMSIGATGFWNNSMHPAIFYVSNKHHFFDATRAEIIGSIDGLIIAKNLPKWIDNFQNLRLSQVLEMYYSNRGVTFEKNVKACERRENFARLTPGMILEEQTSAVSKILAFRNGAIYFTEEKIQEFVNYAINTFSYYANNHIFTEVNCHKEIPHPQVEFIIAFDGAWTEEYTINFLSVLVEDVDVSSYGAKMGLIHGSTGEWLFNITNSSATVHENLRNLTNISWPWNLNYPAVLRTVFRYWETVWKENEEKCKFSNMGQALVLLAPRVRLSESEQKSSLALIEQIKLKHPEIYFFYFATENNVNVFKKFLISNEDRLIRSSDYRDVTRLLLRVPVSLRPLVCKQIADIGKAEIQNYISPEETIIYKLHSHWRSNTKKIALTVHGVGYGAMQICSWTKWKINEVKREFNCQSMTSFEDLSFNDNSSCAKKKNCPNIYYQIQKVTSLSKCTEIECKYPDQVRFILRMDNLYYSHSPKITSQFNLLIFSSILTFFTFI